MVNMVDQTERDALRDACDEADPPHNGRVSIEADRLRALLARDEALERCEALRNHYAGFERVVPSLLVARALDEAIGRD